MGPVKTCITCAERKSVADFYRRSETAFRAECKVCYRAREKAREKDPENRRQIMKRFHARNPDWQKNYDLKRHYGIDLKGFQELEARQGGVCAICGDAERGRSLHVDHNHNTGAVRGLLCTTCNLGIGCFADDPVRLESAIRYLYATTTTEG